ncbi:peptidase M48 [Marivirga tractuosa]|uniref:Peptidase M48 Ste24p n=1 Tax=Marivirga tractuosa (strain ATCC 23168 / DSM 4126 / NBRC 15989 / NCIMB 1408 / VKM B-1430 / H-43) TaxID=643867 RepID=E4TSG6_MARTH|nr:M48 family metalloprotease [Marivirga tractuosa]ADR20786.1 peptidase M48 Ste24p [Marivirga tractuosa DSM 4126]BDD14763.1 peptidase M48 [Marivirga tractuosa]
MKKMKQINIVLIAGILIFNSCKDKNDNFVFPSIEEDVELGAQVAEEIENDPDQFPILDEAEYSEAYAYLNNLLDYILTSGEVQYKDEFVWDIHIIENDSVLNAFATPGGYLYVYTGLIKYLDQEDDLMGVLGHEVAHSDLRHTTRNIQRQYGINILLQLITGEDPSQLEQIAGQIAGTAAGLSFSREFEEEADERSVEYLANTPYACNGAYSFFQKLLDEGQAGGTPAFLSTHPDPEDRVEDINTKAEEIDCDTTPLAPATYEDFKNMLPQ